MDRSSTHNKLRFALVGCPLAGKLSTLSHLLGKKVDVSSSHELTKSVDGLDRVVSLFVLMLRGTPADIEQTRGVDGILFLVDSQTERMAANERFAKFLSTALVGRDIPTVFLANKRDLPSAAPLEDIRGRLVDSGCLVETVAIRGRGVAEALERLIDLSTRSRNP